MIRQFVTGETYNFKDIDDAIAVSNGNMSMAEAARRYEEFIAHAPRTEADEAVVVSIDSDGLTVNFTN